MNHPFHKIIKSLISSHNSTHKIRPASKWQDISNRLYWLLLYKEPRDFLHSFLLALINIGIIAFWLLLIAVLLSY